MNKIDAMPSEKSSPANKTPLEVVQLVWKIAKANPHWGHIRISLQMSLLKVFIAASTVRNILNRSEPSPFKGKNTTNSPDPKEPRSIPAHYPNHAWSVDRTVVKRWGLWPAYVVVAIDHFSRIVVCCRPLKGPNAVWTIDALEQAIQIHGTSKHMISDQESVCTSDAFAELVQHHQIKLCFGAVGKHGSIAVTERVIKSLKYKWLKRVAMIKGYNHLEDLCQSFQEWYNDWRPHNRLEGKTPHQVFEQEVLERPDRDSKVVSFPIEQRFFKETKTTDFRLKEAA